MTVGIVLVAHSAGLAAATAEVVTTLAGDEVSIEPAGGTSDGGMGTSIELIRAAVAAADTGDGVLVLMDMGSSVLTAKTLQADLEDADLENADVWDDGGSPRLRLADAPFVEGAVAAAVLASTGADLDAVARSTEQAWQMRKL